MRKSKKSDLKALIEESKETDKMLFYYKFIAITLALLIPLVIWWGLETRRYYKELKKSAQYHYHQEATPSPSR